MRYDKKTIEKVTANGKTYSKVTLLFEPDKIKKYAKRVRSYGENLTFGEHVCPGLRPHQQPKEEGYWYAMFVGDLMDKYMEKLKELHTV